MADQASIEFTAPAALTSIRSIRGKVAQVASAHGAQGDVLDDIRLCVSEAMSNAVRHAYGAKQGIIEVEVEPAQNALAVVVRDHGMGITETGRNGSEGYGLKIIEKLTSGHVISSAPHGGTEIRMVFALDASAADLRAA